MAIQRALFASLALLIGGGALLVLAALAFGPLVFLASAVVLVIALIVTLVRSIKSAWRARVDAIRTASLADRRVGFKDRLSTLVALSERGESSLWPYLLEETLTQQQEFAVSRVERHRVSQSIYGLFGSGVLAALAALFVLAPADLRLAAKASKRGEITVPAGNLQVRPSDPALDPEAAEVTGDPEAMQELADREQQAAQSDAQGNRAGSSGSSSKLVDKARDFASALQNKLTGRKAPERPKFRLKSTEEAKNRPKSKGAQEGAGSQSDPERLADNGNQQGSAQAPSSRSGNSSEPGEESSQDQAPQSKPNDRMANKPIVGQNKPNSGTGDNFSNGQSEPGGGRNGNGAASHGSGTDPEHLFGRADKPPTPKDGFSITLEARLSENGPTASGHGYVPPKVRSSLNSTQQPDEPLTRSDVPDDDRDTIKRVFER
ncbi:MAG TPA: hypothetical protein VMB26_07865 [Candidatus Binataceae bacterium]|nr:hypothetical protein [Candidatus Binataceae bacterium]